MAILIQTERLVLRQLRLDDLAQWEAICNQPHILRWMPDWEMTREELARLLDRSKRTYQAPNPRENYVVLGMEEGTSQKLIGLVGIGPKPELQNQVEIFYYIDEGFSGQGYTTEAVKGLLRWAFATAGLDYVVAIVQPENRSSRKVVEKLGFVKGDSRFVLHDGKEVLFDYYRLYHLETIPGAAW